MCTQKENPSNFYTLKAVFSVLSTSSAQDRTIFLFFFWYSLFFQLFYFFSAIGITNCLIIFSSGLRGGQSTNWQCLTAFSCEFSISLLFHPIPLWKKVFFWLCPPKKIIPVGAHSDCRGSTWQPDGAARRWAGLEEVQLDSIKVQSVCGWPVDVLGETQVYYT